MKVTLIGHTVLRDQPDDTWKAGFDLWRTGSTACDSLMEFAGRGCYQSWSRPNPTTATNKSYLKNIIDTNHGSVLEHATAVFYVTGVSRDMTHQLVRHRHLSYSEQSQRFVNVELARFIEPPAYEALNEFDQNGVDDVVSTARNNYADLVYVLEKAGYSRKEAREAARAVLPGHTETKITVSGNIRAWRQMIKERATVHADAEIRALAVEVFRNLHDFVAPNAMQDGRIEEVETLNGKHKTVVVLWD